MATTLASIPVVDCDAYARRQIGSELRELRHRVAETAGIGSALEAVKQACPDLMVCEFALPDLTGIELPSEGRGSGALRKIRVPITSAHRDSDDVVAALKSGADYFAAKPINRGELLAGIGAWLRRPANLADSDTVSAGGISLDNTGHRVTVEGHHIILDFDFRDSKHTASLIYKVFGKRVFAFGRVGPNAIEQRCESLDFTCFWHPTDRMMVKANAQNMPG